MSAAGGKAPTAQHAGAGAAAAVPSLQEGAGTAGSHEAPSDSEANDSDAGSPPGSSTELTIIAAASFAPVTLSAAGATCAAGRCTLAPPADGKLTVSLELERKPEGPMPVLARWRDCGEPSTQFFPVTPSSSEYILHHERAFSDLRAGSTCTAEIIEGGWLVFAGNMSMQILAGESHCTLLPRWTV